MNLEFFKNLAKTPHYSNDFIKALVVQSVNIQKAYQKNDGMALTAMISNNVSFPHENRVCIA